ncbi:MAG: hypothetical protein BWX66_01820 [Deltaproteobacteria bacterium ADurb.Bin058]|nr:MAG: hypothetical protein BWX66_01820 [Deltaproteobacteria bacterium ADurb.Bin058]
MLSPLIARIDLGLCLQKTHRNKTMNHEQSWLLDLDFPRSIKEIQCPHFLIGLQRTTLGRRQGLNQAVYKR